MTRARVLQAPRPRNWLVEALVLVVLVLISVNVASGWRSADTANVFPEALLTIPTMRPTTGYTTLTRVITDAITAGSTDHQCACQLRTGKDEVDRTVRRVCASHRRDNVGSGGARK